MLHLYHMFGCSFRIPVTATHFKFQHNCVCTLIIKCKIIFSSFGMYGSYGNGCCQHESGFPSMEQSTNKNVPAIFVWRPFSNCPWYRMSSRVYPSFRMYLPESGSMPINLNVSSGVLWFWMCFPECGDLYTVHVYDLECTCQTREAFYVLECAESGHLSMMSNMSSEDLRYVL